MNTNDYLSLSLVIFDSESSLKKAEERIEDLRRKLKLPIDYEFHCSRNTVFVQRNFIELLSEIDFRFMTIAVKKDDYLKTASYERLAKTMISEICSRFDNLKIEMDSNPALYHCLRKIIREQNLKSIKIRQNKSHSSVYIQVADYVANLSSRRLKGTDKNNWYDSISNKMVALIRLDNKK